MNVSGVVVNVVPAAFQALLRTLSDSPLCDVHMTDESHRIVVTIEGEDAAEESQKLNQIQSMAHVISADLVYSYSEDELDQLRANVDARSDEVPAFLNDDSVRAEDISYGGRVAGSK